MLHLISRHRQSCALTSLGRAHIQIPRANFFRLSPERFSPDPSLPPWVNDLIKQPDYRTLKYISDEDGQRRRLGFKGRMYSQETSFQMRFLWFHHTRVMRALVHFGPDCEGPPGCVHGGALATILDETLGICSWLANSVGVTANLSIDYRTPVPLNSLKLAEAFVEKIEGRKVYLRGHICDGETGEVHTEAKGLWILVQDEDKRRLAAERTFLDAPT